MTRSFYIGENVKEEDVQEIDAVDDMFIEGIYEYIGENSDVFTKAEYHWMVFCFLMLSLWSEDHKKRKVHCIKGKLNS